MTISITSFLCGNHDPPNFKGLRNNFDILLIAITVVEGLTFLKTEVVQFEVRSEDNTRPRENSARPERVVAAAAQRVRAARLLVIEHELLLPRNDLI